MRIFNYFPLGIFNYFPLGNILNLTRDGNVLKSCYNTGGRFSNLSHSSQDSDFLEASTGKSNKSQWKLMLEIQDISPRKKKSMMRYKLHTFFLISAFTLPFSSLFDVRSFFITFSVSLQNID
jgi:hypothetical protein